MSFINLNANIVMVPDLIVSYGELALTKWSFAHMPLSLSDRNN